MTENNEIIIDANNDEEQGLKSQESKEEQINSLENEYLNELEQDNKNEENQNQIDNENEEYNDFENHNETEVINNNINNDINKKIVSQKESTTTINNTNINDNISTIPTKEEQNLESYIQNQSNLQKNIQQNNNNIIDESDEYKTLENIINSKNNYKNQKNIKQNSFNNNKVYFTEANILKKRHITKSNSTNLYNISSIPEYPHLYHKKVKFSIHNELNSEEKRKGKSSQKTVKNSINEKLNNLTPNDYMKKIYVNKYNFRPLQYRIKKIEEELEKQNKYDYEKVMKELQLQLDKNIKNKEKQKHFLEINKKFEEKLKNMEEKRTNLNNQRLHKILKKLKKFSNSNDRNKNKNNSNENSENHFSNNLENINSNTIELYGYKNNNNEKLPLIQNLPKYKKIKMIKDKNEEEFCTLTLDKIKENEMIHRINYLKQINSINSKFLKRNKLYRQRSMQCLISIKNKNEQLKEELIEKDMLKSYKIKQILIREYSAKNERIKYNYIKKLDDAKEKREIIERKNKEKIKQIIKKLNREVKKDSFSGNNREFFSSLQRQNYKQCNKDSNDYYKDLILRQSDNLLIIDELQKNENYIKQEILKRSLQEQNTKNKELKSLDTFVDKIQKTNINNQNEGTIKKLFQEKIKIENEIKRKEEEK